LVGKWSVFSLLICSSDSVANILGLPWMPVTIHWDGVWLEFSGQSVSIPYLLSGSVAIRLGLSLIPYLPSGSVENGRGEPLGSSLASLSALMSSVASILGSARMIESPYLFSWTV
jgi:hypothetical protein